MLAARARRAEHVHFDILVADLDVDLFIHDGIHENRREARVAPRLRVERRDAYEAMYAGFRFEESERVQPLDLDHRALDTGLLAVALIEHLDGVALSLRPSLVHSHQHRCPVLGFGASRSCADLELRVAEVIGSGEQRLQTECL